GAGATVVLDPNQAGSLFDSSIPITNMHTLEWLAYYIDPPRWPEAAFGAIKPDLAAAGATIFRTTCAERHEDDQRTQSGLIPLRGKRLEDVGTDATAALRISCPVPDPGALSSLMQPRPFTVDDSRLLKDCAGVTAGTAFEGASFARTVQAAVDRIK